MFYGSVEVNKMKVLVIGGAGNIGTAVVQGAVKAGFDVYPVTRRKKKWMNEHIHPIQGDWANNDTAKNILENTKYDVIVDGLLMQLPMAKRDLDLAKGHCKHFIFISSDGVYNRPAMEIKEDACINLHDIHWDIMYNKRKIELYIDEKRSQYPYMITTIRPSVTYGMDRIPCGILSRKNQWTLVDRIIKEKPIVFADDGGTLHPITPAEVFGDAVAGIFLNEKANGETYHVSNEHGYTWDEIAYSIGDLVGHRPKIVHVPVGWLKKYNRQLYIEIINDKFDTLTLDITKLRLISPNVNYNMELKESLKDTISYLRENKACEPMDENFNFMCDDILIKYSQVGLNEIEKRFAIDFIKTLSVREINNIRHSAKKNAFKDYISYVYYELRKIAFKILPLRAVCFIRKIKKLLKAKGLCIA